MSRPLLEYHSLEDGELNRLWYEENDPRARDAFRLRWWLGGDPIAGKDLFAEYHNLLYHRCLERNVLPEDDHVAVFRRSVETIVSEFPSEPIAKFEDLFLPHVDRALDDFLRNRPRPATLDAAEAKRRVDAILDEGGEAGALVRAWVAGEKPDAGDAVYERAFALLQKIVLALDGPDAKQLQPIIRTEKPPPSKLDPSVALPHFEARQLFTFAAHDDDLSKREHQHLEWRQACRERGLGTRMVLRRLRQLYGGPVPDLPFVSPELADLFQKENPDIPAVGPATSAGSGSRGSGRGTMAAVIIAVVLIAIALVAVLR